MTVPHHWRKSSYSGNQTNCVEVGRVDDGAAIRDSKDRVSSYFTTTRSQWQTFVDAVKSDRFTN